MLLSGSISTKVFLLVLVQHLTAQEDYGVDESEDISDHSDFSIDDGEHHEHPDYSKYYSVDDSAPLVATQGSTGGSFISPTEFSGFLSPNPIEYQESNRKPIALPPVNFIPQQQQQQQTQALPNLAPVQDITNYYLSNPLRDFFEEAQKKQEVTEASEDYVAPGPSYISHKLPLFENYDEEKSASRDDVERIPPRPNKPRKQSSGSEDDEGYTNVEKEIEKESASAKYSHELLTNSKPRVDYNTGKSSSTVSQFPAAEGIIQPASSYLTPYQKYSFQPSVSPSNVELSSRYLEAVKSTVAPFNPSYKQVTEPLVEGQSSEDVPSHLKGQNCRRLSKPASSQSEAMNCFVCENAENKSKYTQCSYTSEQEPQEYYQGNSERFSQPAGENQFRYKRHAKRNNDPYYHIRERSRKASEEPSIPADYNAGFKYEPEFYDESQHEVSYSEKQTEKLKKDPKNCKKVVKEDGSTCTICRNPDNGGNYEQCSYTSEPKSKKYAYVTERKFDGDEPEKEEESSKAEEAESAQKPVKKPEPELIEDHDGHIEQKSPRKRNEEDSFYSRNYGDDDKSENAKEKKADDDDDERYEVPSAYKGKRKYESGSSDSPRRFDDYHLTLFPELAREESKQDDEHAEYQIPAATKQNVEEVLAEFSKKDRSSCKKSEKKGMTCYLCVDKNNIQHEECMFVQESNPKSSHVAYHQLKGAKKLEDGESHPEETKEKPVISDVKRRRSSKIAHNPIVTLETAASEDIEIRIPYDIEGEIIREKRSTKEVKKSEADPTPAFDVADEEGAYSEETKPVYSKMLDASLPRYMVDKSEFEAEFDSVSRAF